MSSPDDNGTQLEIERLGKELEQAKVALEQTLEEAEHLATERDEAMKTVARQRALITTSERTAARLREELAGMVLTATQFPKPESRDEALRVMLEESTMLAEELNAVNEALSRTNRELDDRVMERTRALDRAMAELERMNLELNRRVEKETEARARAQAELFQVQKLEAIGQLTGGIAHDFNNLLTVIITGLQMVGTALKEDPRRARVLRRTEEAAWRGADLTRQLLTFARRQPLHPDRVELEHHLESVRELLAHSLRADIDIGTELQQEQT